MRGKKILLGITGSIAAYKSALLVRLLVKAGAEVKVVMTKAAIDFITPLTLSTLSKNPVYSEYANQETGEWSNHVELGLWADAFVIAPASANTISKMANGVCDNLLLAVYLSAKCKVFFAPAMDLDMHKHPATQENIARLVSFGNQLISATSGELASGLHGEGRMEEPELIIDALEKYFNADLPLKGKKALVTAGPTFEAIDPVRFIGNRSSGKMGYAIAEELATQGADVLLVSGPGNLSVINSRITRVDIESAEEMLNACMKDFSEKDIIVMSAAVADYKPADVASEKLKKKNNEMPLPLIPTQDILALMGEKKGKKQFIVGFALETENELENAKGKLQKKNLDLVVLNSLKDEGAGFNHDTNKITIIDKKGSEYNFGLKSKQEVAKDLVNLIITNITNTTV
ncbi:MAG: bifunctional phosphopantothenoylcysteine decarboxylase/phosphopantothenate--cysteine ligase CoaBC [Bacteroidetes bacterium]|nr:bifunctional phosphopantothenoylcysteine decarboxylase/phosphopantothenate--cysteine ligase CoaBC [Bacteroidota bacterium]MBK9412867.1 bifunctional phosphopantothenoylcysteine decarboxylase/phosphopantothenate--cysteine ligase CoaBC [Bacteroidota bacterium]MBP6657826.1 bifunctional phosphopantothenoylcysteine decarboxylase/phosphopantothenate--cysteine ligase CoaBC [Bacteroidia bacterium]